MQTNIHLLTKNYKHTKINYHSQILKKILLKQNFLIFFYDFFTELNLPVFTNYLIKQNFKIFKLKKKIFFNLFSQDKFLNFRNIFKNNILLIYSENQFTKSNLKNFKTFFNLHLCGIWENKKLYRPSEYEIYLNLSDQIKKKPIITINNIFKKIKLNLIFLKKL